MRINVPPFFSQSIVGSGAAACGWASGASAAPAGAGWFCAPPDAAAFCACAGSVNRRTSADASAQIHRPNIAVPPTHPEPTLRVRSNQHNLAALVQIRLVAQTNVLVEKKRFA